MASAASALNPRADPQSWMEFPVLDVVFIAGILGLMAVIALVAKAVERL